MVDRLRGVPAWAWLVTIVLASFALRAWLAREMLGPFIMVDELIYSELGRSIASGDGFQVRDVPAGGFSLVYPILISPAYALFDSLPDAYGAVKTLNALYMSLAAVPAYLLARRVLAPPLSLFAAVLAVALPSLVYTGTVMTENAFYPLFLTGALLLVLVLEQPTPARQVGLIALVGVLFATRVQAIAFVPAIVAAPFLLALLGRRPLRATLWSFRLLYGLLAAGAVLLLGVQVARGQSLSDLLGAYAIVGESSYDTETVARFFLYHLAELDLYLGVLPFAAFVLLALLARRLDEAVAPFLAAGIALSTSVLLVVAAFASEFANRIQERNVFVVAPFFLIALLVLVDRGLPRPLWLAPPVAVGAALLPLTIPWERFIETAAISDTLALLPIWAAFGSLPFDSIDATVLIGGAIAAALFLLVPRRFALVLPVATLLFFAAIGHNVWGGERGVKRASAGALFTGMRVGERDWIDRALPDGATASVVWTGITDRFVVNQNEFFNRKVGPVYFIGGPTPGGLAETEVTVDEATRGAPHGRRRARAGALPARRGPDLAGRRRRRPRPGDGAHPLAHRRPARRDDDAGRGPLSEGHVVGPHRDLDPGALSRRTPDGLAHERPEPLRREPGRDRVREREACGQGERRAVRDRGAPRPHGSRRRRHVPRRLPDGEDEGARQRTTLARSAPTSGHSSTVREDRVRRQPALAPADGDRQLRSRLARRAGRGGGGEARARRLRADPPARPQVDPRGAGRPPGRAAHRRPAVVARLPDGLEPCRPALRGALPRPGRRAPLQRLARAAAARTGSARRWCTTSCRCSTRSG